MSTLETRKAALAGQDEDSLDRERPPHADHCRRIHQQQERLLTLLGGGDALSGDKALLLMALALCYVKFGPAP
jgi:hypothetical protein